MPLTTNIFTDLSEPGVPLDAGIYNQDFLEGYGTDTLAGGTYTGTKGTSSLSAINGQTIVNINLGGVNNNRFTVCLAGTLAQNFLPSPVVFSGSPTWKNYFSGSAQTGGFTVQVANATFDTTTFPGYSVWHWEDAGGVGGQGADFGWISGNPSGTVTFGAIVDSITISPHTASVPVGSSLLFTATTVPAGLAATWSVNGVVGGDSVHGTVVDGYYVAPTLPNGITTVTVTATRQDQPLSDSATVTLTIPTIGGGSSPPGQPAFITGKFRGPKAFAPVELSKAATIPLRVYEPNENKTFKG